MPSPASDRIGLHAMRIAIAIAIAIVFFWIGGLKFVPYEADSILTIGLLTLAGLVSRRLGLLGAALAVGTSFVTLSFLVTTPEA